MLLWLKNIGKVDNEMGEKEVGEEHPNAGKYIVENLW